MNEQEIPEEQKSSPYDLWPDEPPTVKTSPFAGSPFDQPSETPFEAPFVPVAYTPDTTDETVRKSGLAWSAGVVFVGAVAFMLFLGWLADLLLGTSPWGIVGGIVIGSIIGFIQLVRISSQIYSPKKTEPEHRPLLSRNDDEE